VCTICTSANQLRVANADDESLLTVDRTTNVTFVKHLNATQCHCGDNDVDVQSQFAELRRLVMNVSRHRNSQIRPLFSIPSDNLPKS
jgi:hypothetical protein